MDIAQVITDRIISELEKGAAPWVKPWRNLRGVPGQGMPFNPASGTVYRGANHFWLGMQAWAMPWYVTFKQAQDLGGNVKAGEKGTPVIYWNMLKKDTQGENGETESAFIPFIKHYWVFNVEQCEGLSLPEVPEQPKTDWDPMPEVLAIVERLQLSGEVQHGGDSAFYMPSRDTISMPPMAAFESPEHYHATLLHESVHATGAKHRLNRLTPARFGSEEYAYEELVAELGAAMLCAHTGVNGDLRHAGYIQSWLKALKNDKKFILSAAGKAQAAMDWLTNQTTKTVEDQESETLAA